MKKLKIVSALMVAFALCFGNVAAISTVEAHSSCHKSSKTKYYYHGHKAHTHKNGVCPYR